MIFLPRPWFLSITALWSEADGFTRLREILRDLADTVPAHQLAIPESIWHHTAFAVARFNAMPVGSTAESFVENFLSDLLSKEADLLGRLSSGFSAYGMEAHEVIAWDSATSVQLRPLCSGLHDFRASAAKLLSSPVAALCSRVNATLGTSYSNFSPGAPIAESLTGDPKKSVGALASGSIARSPFPNEASVPRWRCPLGPVPLWIHSMRLVVSDQVLSNPAARRKSNQIVALRSR
jgi:hypothetical protein